MTNHPIPYIHHPAVNTAAVITRAAVADSIHVLHRLTASLDRDFTNVARLSVAVNAVEIWGLDLQDKGVYDFDFGAHGLHMNVKNQAMVITLGAGGGLSDLGKVNALIS
jgi:hypothetical protein